MNYIASTWWALVLLLPILAVMGQSNKKKPTTNVLQPFNLSNSINQFSLDFHNILTENTNENIVSSPISVFVLLSMLLVGSKGTTSFQILNALHLRNPDGRQYRQGIKKLTNRFNGKSAMPKLVLANKIYLRENVKIKEKYQQLLNRTFNASAESINFSDSQKASSTINNWVEQKTDNVINDIVKPIDFDDLTEFVLVNTLYFKGIWKYTFDFQNDHRFQIAGISRNVNGMVCRSTFANGDFENLAASVIEIPYKIEQGSEETKMIVVLPKEGVSLNEVEKKIKQHGLPTSVNLTHEDIQLSLPKFKFSSTFDLQSSLEKLNLTKLFNNPNFSGITGSNVHISKMVHKVIIDVNEEGTEAAAASVVELYTLTSHEKVKMFTVNRPFLVFISTRDVILFTGRVVDPGNGLRRKDPILLLED